MTDQELIARLLDLETDLADCAVDRIEALTKERDTAREYAGEVRKREMAVEDARISATDKLATCEKYRDAYAECDRIGTQAVRDLEAKLTKAVGVIKALLKRDERNTCQHENTERGGVLWEICLDCGCKWADDDGGKPTWKDPQEWVDARAVLAELEGK